MNTRGIVTSVAIALGCAILAGDVWSSPTDRAEATVKVLDTPHREDATVSRRSTRTYSSHPPYPRFTFQYSAAYRALGEDIGAMMLAVNDNDEPTLVVGCVPTEARTLEDVIKERQLTQLAARRCIDGYAAVSVSTIRDGGVKPVGEHDSAWLMLVDARTSDRSKDATRWVIALPDDKIILTSFRLATKCKEIGGGHVGETCCHSERR